jgi:hypothetical protein
LEKVEKGRGIGKTTIFYLPSLTIQNRGAGGQGGWPGGGGRGAGDPGHGDGREVGQNREEVEGNSFRSSPWSGTDCGGRSTAAGGLQPRRHERWLLEAREGERKAGVAWG